MSRPGRPGRQKPSATRPRCSRVRVWMRWMIGVPGLHHTRSGGGVTATLQHEQSAPGSEGSQNERGRLWRHVADAVVDVGRPELEEVKNAFRTNFDGTGAPVVWKQNRRDTSDVGRLTVVCVRVENQTRTRTCRITVHRASGIGEPDHIAQDCPVRILPDPDITCCHRLRQEIGEHRRVSPLGRVWRERPLQGGKRPAVQADPPVAVLVEIQDERRLCLTEANDQNEAYRPNETDAKPPVVRHDTASSRGLGCSLPTSPSDSFPDERGSSMRNCVIYTPRRDWNGANDRNQVNCEKNWSFEDESASRWRN
jgi:hypothetical protein